MDWTPLGFFHTWKLNGDDTVGVTGEYGVLQKRDHAALGIGRCVLDRKSREPACIVGFYSGLRLIRVVGPALQAGTYRFIELTNAVHDVLFERWIPIGFHKVSQIGHFCGCLSGVEQMSHELLFGDRLGKERFGLEERHNDDNGCKSRGTIDHPIVFVAVHGGVLTGYNGRVSMLLRRNEQMHRFFLILLIGCRTEGVVEALPDDTGGMQSGDTGEDQETGGAAEAEPIWCLDFESGDLTEVGYEGPQVTLGNEALLANVAEGDNFLALTGEERVVFRGDHALLMRAYPLAQPALLAVATTSFFMVEEPDFSWFQLSEVSSGGVWLAADVMAPDGRVLASLEIPVETGGHLAGLPPDFSPIEGLNDVVVGEGFPGEFVGQRIDLGPFIGETISLRFYQYSRIPDNAFFTLFDDLCSGWSAEIADLNLLALEEPQDWGF